MTSRRQCKCPDPKRRGILDTRKPHPMHRQWSFEYEIRGATGWTDELDNTDLYMCTTSYPHIHKGAILLYMGENASRVSCDLQLPPQVTRVIIHKYGKKQAICFAKKFHGTVIVRPGDELDGDPYEEK